MLEAELHAAITQIEREAYFGESCNAENYLRGLAQQAVASSQLAIARAIGPMADSLKQIREGRFPDLVKTIKKGSH